MKIRRKSMIVLTPAMAILFVIIMSACRGETGTPSSSPTATPPSTAADTQPPQSGDIPDTQAFVTYTSVAGNYSLDVPEGWTRTINGADVQFIDHFDGVKVALTQTNTAPTLESMHTQQVLDLEKAERAVRDVQVQSKQLANGSSILITYTSDSEPNAVTGKQIRLENNRYHFFHNGKLAILTLWAPQGADNVDQWSRVANSFKWV